MEIRQPMADEFNLLTLLLSALDTIFEIISKRICTTIEGRFRPSLVCYISAMVVNFFHTSAWRYASTHPFGTYSLQVVKVESVKPPSYWANEGGVSAFIYILASEGQYRKADGPIDSKLRERVTSFSEVQPPRIVYVSDRDELFLANDEQIM